MGPAREGAHIPWYFGPPPPSGTTHSMFSYGSAMSHVLQCTQFEKLTVGPFGALSFGHSYTVVGQKC